MMKYPGLLLVLLLCGCAETPDAAAPGRLYPKRISAPRQERSLAAKEAALATIHSRRMETEIALARRKLAAHGLRLKAPALDDRAKLSSFLRSGRADLIAGALTADEARQWLLTPVLPYAGKDARENCCFAVRRGDDALAALLGGPVSKTAGDNAGDRHD